MGDKVISHIDDKVVTFQGISRDAFTRMQEESTKKGLILSADSGEATSHGVTVKYEYHPLMKTLSIEVTDKSRWVPMSWVTAGIQSGLTDFLKG